MINPKPNPKMKHLASKISKLTKEGLIRFNLNRIKNDDTCLEYDNSKHDRFYSVVTVGIIAENIRYILTLMGDFTLTCFYKRPM